MLDGPALAGGEWDSAVAMGNITAYRSSRSLRIMRTRPARTRPLAFIALCFGSVLIGTPAAAGTDELSVSREQELNFGALTVMAPSGVITVRTSGYPEYSNAVRVGGQTGPARFVFRGKPNRLVEVIIMDPPPGSFGASGTSTLDSLDVEADYGREFERLPGAVRLRLDPGGLNALTIGGRLTVTPNNSSGATYIPIPISAVYVDKGQDEPAPADPGKGKDPKDVGGKDPKIGAGTDPKDKKDPKNG